MRKQKVNKLSLKKFQIAKINNPKAIIGGDGGDGGGVTPLKGLLESLKGKK